MTVGCHPSLPTQYRAAPRLYLATTTRCGVLRDARGASEPSHRNAEPEKQATCGCHQHHVETGEREASGAVRLGDAAGARVLLDRGRVVIAAAVVDRALDDPTRLGVAGLGRGGGHCR